MANRLYKSKRFWIGIAITIVCLVLAFQGIQLDRLMGAFARLNWLWLIPLTVAFWVSYGGRVYRWQLLFYPYRVRWLRVLGTLSVGYFLSNITPLRIGDVVRAYLLGTLERVSVAYALSTVVVERTLDGLTVVLLFVALLPLIPGIPEDWRVGGVTLGATGLALLLSVSILSLQKERGMGLLRRIAAPFPFVNREGLWRFIGNLIDGFAVVRQPRPFAGAVGWSLEIWLISAVLSWFMMFAMGLDLPFVAALLVQVLTALAVTIAPSPGQFGVFHVTTRFALQNLFGVNGETALAYAFAVHGFVYLWLTGLGLLFAWREGLDLAQIQKIGAEETLDEHMAEVTG